MAMRVHLVEDGLWVGSCPMSVEDSATLASAGVQGLVSLQSDDDLRSLGLRWEVLWQAHVAAGLTVERVPIRDFDKRHLAASVEAALEPVLRMRADGLGVYVHCTAGLNRSTTVVIAALATLHDISLEAAAERLMAAHPNAVPYVDALGRWWKRRVR